MLNIERYKDEIEGNLIDSDDLDLAICNSFESHNTTRFWNIDDVFNWMFEEYKEPILTDSEREYLKIVFKPFHKRIEYITKAEDGDGESIDYMYDDEHSAWLPPFEKGTMYKNMELYKWYTLEELGITYD